MTKIAKDWTLKRFADHYVNVINTPAVNGVHKSAIFGDSSNVLLIATTRFGQAKAHAAFAKAVGNADDNLKKDTPEK